MGTRKQLWKKAVSAGLSLVLAVSLLGSVLPGAAGTGTAKAASGGYEINRVLVPVADTYVDSGVSPPLVAGEDAETIRNKNYGASASLQSYGYNDSFTLPTSQRTDYLRFDLSGLGEFNSAKLRLYCTANCTYTPATPEKLVRVYKVTDDSWSENELTWYTRPGFPAGITAAQLTALQLAAVNVSQGGGWYEWDLTGYIQAEKASGVTSIAVRAMNQKVSFSSREGANPPQLLVHTDLVPPDYAGAAVSGGNRIISLKFTEPVLNALSGLPALKAAVTLARNGTQFAPLAAGDTVALAGDTLTVTLQERLAQPGAVIRLQAQALQDGVGNKLLNPAEEALAYDSQPPQAVRTFTRSLHQELVLEFDEPLVSLAADAESLKAAVSLAADGGAFAPLAVEDAVYVADRQIAVTFPQPLAGSHYDLRVAGGVLADASGNQANAPITASAELDRQPPAYTDSSLMLLNRRISLHFNEPLEAVAASLAGAVTIQTEAGGSFAPLPASSLAFISGSSLIVEPKTAITGPVRLRLAPGSIRDVFQNPLAAEVTTEELSPAVASYTYPGFHTQQVEKAIAMDQPTPADSGQTPEGYKQFVVLATELAKGDRTPALVQAFTGAVRKMISDYAYMPDVDGGLEARNNIYLTYGLGLVWPLSDIMSQFTAQEISKLKTFLKAELVSSAFVLSATDHNGSVRAMGSSRTEMDGGVNSWPHTAPNYMEPIFGVMMAAILILGPDEADAFLKSYSHNSFRTELGNQGLTRIKEKFDLTSYKRINPVVNSTSWRFTTSGGQTVTMAQIMEDPVQAFAALSAFTYFHPAEDGRYIGQMGMLREFRTSDSGGNRESSVYAKHGLEPSLVNRLLLDYYGYLDATAYQEERDALLNLQKVGADDYYAKVVNGYFTVSATSAGIYHDEENIMSELSMLTQLYQPSLWNDSFDYEPGAIGDLGADTIWNLPEGNWSAAYKVIVPYNIKTSANTKKPTGLTDPSERSFRISGASSVPGLAYSKRSFGDIRYQAWVQFTDARQIGILGKVSDGSHYYLLSYDHTQKKVAIKKQNGQTLTTLAETGKVLNPGKSYRFQGEFAGGGITFSINGQPVLSAVDSSAPFIRGGVGFMAQGEEAYFDAVVVQPLAPEAPVLEEIKTGEGRLELHYSTVPDAYGYVIRYGTHPGVYTEELFTRRKSSETVAPLQNGTAYYFAVAALTHQGESPLSNELSQTPAVNTAVTPQLLAVIPTADGAALHFTADPANTAYTITYGAQPGQYPWTVANVTASVYGTPGENGSTVTQAVYEVGLPFGQTPFYFRIAGVNGTGESAPSNVLSGWKDSGLLYQDDFSAGAQTSIWMPTYLSSGADGSNRYVRTLSTGLSRGYLTAGYDWGDYRVSADFTPQGDRIEQMLVLGRVKDTNNYYLMGYYLGEYAIFVKEAGTIVKLAGAPAAAVKGQTYHIEGKFDGSMLSLYVDGQLRITADNDQLPSGTGGFLTNNTQAAVDNFRVEQPAPSGTPFSPLE